MSVDNKQLMLDVGNSRTKYAVLHQGRLIRTGVISRDSELDELFETVSDCWLAAVGQSQMLPQIQCLSEVHSVKLHTLQSRASQCGVSSGYREPSKLGIDRWLVMIACRHWTNEAFAVVDLGTAATCDFVDSTGQHMGGWIAPGLRTMQSALFTNTELPIHQSESLSFEGPGLETQQAIEQGCLASLCGFVSMAESFLQKREKNYQIFLTGGDARLYPFEHNSHVSPAYDAVFYGIKRIILDKAAN